MAGMIFAAQLIWEQNINLSVSLISTKAFDSQYQQGPMEGPSELAALTDSLYWLQIFMIVRVLEDGKCFNP